MTEGSLDSISGLLPADFFRIEIDIPYIGKKEAKKPLSKKALLPDLSDLTFEESFAEVSMGWNEGGLVVDATVKKPFEEAHYPDYRKGDSIELFIDTRNLKSAGFPTRFCHHFVILPAVVEGVQAVEVTTFRTDDRHELCLSELIGVSVDLGKRKYFVKINLPSEALHGYDPNGFEQLGFAYQINRTGADPGHLMPSSHHLSIEQNPSLWSTIRVR